MGHNVWHLIHTGLNCDIYEVQILILGELLACIKKKRLKRKGTGNLQCQRQIKWKAYDPKLTLVYVYSHSPTTCGFLFYKKNSELPSFTSTLYKLHTFPLSNSPYQWKRRFSSYLFLQWSFCCTIGSLASH